MKSTQRPGLVGRPLKLSRRPDMRNNMGLDRPMRAPQPMVREPWRDPFDRFMQGLETQARIEAHRLNELEL